jgi:hypothetical protein
LHIVIYTSPSNNFRYICDIYITFIGCPPRDVTQLFGPHSDLAARPVVFVFPLRLTSKFNDHECRGFLHPDGLAWDHWRRESPETAD